MPVREISIETTGSSESIRSGSASEHDVSQQSPATTPAPSSPAPHQYSPKSPIALSNSQSPGNSQNLSQEIIDRSNDVLKRLEKRKRKEKRKKVNAVKKKIRKEERKERKRKKKERKEKRKKRKRRKQARLPVIKKVKIQIPGSSRNSYAGKDKFTFNNTRIKRFGGKFTDTYVYFKANVAWAKELEKRTAEGFQKWCKNPKNQHLNDKNASGKKRVRSQKYGYFTEIEKAVVAEVNRRVQSGEPRDDATILGWIKTEEFIKKKWDYLRQKKDENGEIISQGFLCSMQWYRRIKERHNITTKVKTGKPKMSTPQFLVVQFGDGENVEGFLVKQRKFWKKHRLIHKGRLNGRYVYNPDEIPIILQGKTLKQVSFLFCYSSTSKFCIQTGGSKRFESKSEDSFKSRIKYTFCSR